MRRNLGFWLILAMAPAPLFFNCHRATDLRFLQQEDSSSTDGGSTDNNSDDSLVHAFEPAQDRPKIAIDPGTLQTGSSLGGGGAGNLAAKAGASDEFIVPSGLRLYALVDNDCLTRKLSTPGASKAAQESLSSKVKDVSTGEIGDLKIQAYGFENPSALTLSQLTQEADADECVLRIANDEKVQLLPPRAAQAKALPQASTQSFASLAMATNDPGLASQKHLSAIKAPAGWNVFYSPGRGITQTVTVALVDSGTDYTHEDLSANMWTSSTGTHGRDFENNDMDPMDDNGHGTHVSGLMGAVSGNGIGVTGVMGKNIRIMSVKVTDAEGRAYPSTILNGVRWAADNGAEVINMSLGFPGASDELHDAVAYASSKGAVVVVAAGNDAKLLDATNYSAPANYASGIPGAIAVGSIDSESGAMSSFSNYSPTLVQISAPGSNGIWSTVPGGYQTLQGTSMATPIVSGTAALIVGLVKSQGLTIANSEVISILKATARSNATNAAYFQNGATLDLDRLGRYMKNRYLIETDGGTESPF